MPSKFAVISFLASSVLQFAKNKVQYLQQEIHYIHKQDYFGPMYFLCPSNLASMPCICCPGREMPTKADPVLRVLAVIAVGISLRCDHRSINLFFSRIHCLPSLYSYMPFVCHINGERDATLRVTTLKHFLQHVRSSS